MTYFWFRRDLRIEDNAALYYALKQGKDIQCVFIFDKDILDKLSSKEDHRLIFIHEQIEKINKELQAHNSSLQVYYGKPHEVWEDLLSKNTVEALYCNRDYEPYAIQRDKDVRSLCEEHTVEFIAKKDQVIFDRNEIVKNDGDPYTVFTPYSKKWKSKLNDFYKKPYPTAKYLSNLKKVKDPAEIISLKEMGFKKTQVEFPDDEVSNELLKEYKEKRDFPAKQGTSRLSVHLRFGTVSIRELVNKTIDTSEVWLNELIWRDFYHMILYHFPHSAEKAFRSKYNHIPWLNDEDHFQKWCEGKTGYPLVDAGMRELNQTGFMHNRVRMVVASFLTKHLLTDWKWGERYFAEKLLDYDLASNVGGWQWAAGSGCDAAPYFRVFNPTSQLDKFDKDRRYVKKWVPEYGTSSYPEPIVEHKFARQRAIDTYKETLSKFS